MNAAYVPQSGDLVWLTFDPQAGHVEAGRRPFPATEEAVDEVRGKLVALVGY